nr:unnamed protein product [Digitaria exilis]
MDEDHTGGGGRSRRSQNPTQPSELRFSWMARKWRPPHAFFAASQASASCVAAGMYLDDTPADRIRLALPVSTSIAQISIPFIHAENG